MSSELDRDEVYVWITTCISSHQADLAIAAAEAQSATSRNPCQVLIWHHSLGAGVGKELASHLGAD